MGPYLHDPLGSRVVFDSFGEKNIASIHVEIVIFITGIQKMHIHKKIMSKMNLCVEDTDLFCFLVNQEASDSQN